MISDVSQMPVLGPPLLLISINDIPDRPNTKPNIFADDSALLARDY
jgi:hypothetical protein